MIQILCTNGYMATFMPHHPMSASNGYIYVHRLVMAIRLGRMLTPEEEVHHKNERKTDNRLSNLEVLTSLEHRKHHRKSGKRLRDPGEPNPLVFCQCGCEERFPMFDGQGRFRKFKIGHNSESRDAQRQRVLAYVSSLGPLTRASILSATGVSSSNLYWIEKQGLIKRVRRGLWEVSNG